MNKILSLVGIAVFFAFSVSAIDQYIWSNDFSWLNAGIGFILGGVMYLLSGQNEYQRH